MVEINEEQVLSIIKKSKDTGSVRIGVNEVTKSIERKQAKAVFSANNVEPKEIIAHFEGLCKEMEIPFFSVGTKENLGQTVGIKSTSSISVVDFGGAKGDFEKLNSQREKPKKEEKTEKVEETKTEEKKVEEKKEEKVSEEKKEEKVEEEEEKKEEVEEEENKKE